MLLPLAVCCPAIRSIFRSLFTQVTIFLQADGPQGEASCTTVRTSVVASTNISTPLQDVPPPHIAISTISKISTHRNCTYTPHLLNPINAYTIYDPPATTGKTQHIQAETINLPLFQSSLPSILFLP